MRLYDNDEITTNRLCHWFESSSGGAPSICVALTNCSGIEGENGRADLLLTIFFYLKNVYTVDIANWKNATNTANWPISLQEVKIKPTEKKTIQPQAWIWGQKVFRQVLSKRYGKHMEILQEPSIPSS